jgi:hypothetical protein
MHFFSYSLNIVDSTKFRDPDFGNRIGFYYEMVKWCKDNIGDENFALTSEYNSPGVAPDWYIHTATEEDMVIFKLKFLNARQG